MVAPSDECALRHSRGDIRRAREWDEAAVVEKEVKILLVNLAASEADRLSDAETDDQARSVASHLSSSLADKVQFTVAKNDAPVFFQGVRPHRNSGVFHSCRDESRHELATIVAVSPLPPSSKRR